MITHTVTFYNLDTPEGSLTTGTVILDPNAPIEAVFECESFNEAFDLVLEFGNDYASAITEVK